MKLTKNICLILFIIINILFTVGYSTLPIFSIRVENIKVETIFYVNNSELKIDGYENANSKIYYNDLPVKDAASFILKALIYSCIAITSLLAVGVIIAFFGLKFVSKMLFLIAFILMILLFSILVMIVYKHKAFKDFIEYFTGENKSEFNYESGGKLINVSAAGMFITYLIYSFMA